MNIATVGGIARTILVGAGGFLVGKGWIDAETLDQIVGAIIVIGGGIWSVLQKKKAAKDIAVAAQTGVNPTTTEAPKA